MSKRPIRILTNMQGLDRCLIISEEPEASDVLTNEAVIVPAEEPETPSISTLWADANLRESISLRGCKYTVLAGSEDRLYFAG